MRAVATDFLAPRVADDKLRDHEADIALQMLDIIDYQLADWGGGADDRDALSDLVAHPVMGKAREKTAERDRGRRERMRAALGRPRARPDRELGPEQKKLAAAMDAIGDAARETHTQLVLFPAPIQRSRDRSKIRIPLEVNVYRGHVGRLLEEPTVVDAIERMKEGVRAQYPAAEIFLQVVPLALGQGISDPRHVAIALTYAGAKSTLAACGLDEHPVPDPLDELEAELQGASPGSPPPPLESIDGAREPQRARLRSVGTVRSSKRHGGTDDPAASTARCSPSPEPLAAAASARHRSAG